MCVPIGQRDSRARLMMVIGNLSLVAGLLIWNFVRHSTAATHFSATQSWIDGLGGLFLGISIGVNLAALLRQRRCGGRGPLY